MHPTVEPDQPSDPALAGQRPVCRGDRSPHHAGHDGGGGPIDTATGLLAVIGRLVGDWPGVARLAVLAGVLLVLVTMAAVVVLAMVAVLPVDVVIGPVVISH